MQTWTLPCYRNTVGTAGDSVGVGCVGKRSPWKLWGWSWAAVNSLLVGRLELARMQELIRRFLPPPPGVVLDGGGAPGRYSCWLAEQGYEVHLVDPVEKHVKQARQASRSQPEHPLASATQGDARSLDHGDGSADAVLLMGPLYHLTDRIDRLSALREAHRVLKPGGLLIAKAISRFASLLSGLIDSHIDDPNFIPIVRRDLEEGQHRGQ